MLPREIFLNDVDQLLTRLEQAASIEAPCVDEICRILHTYKGNAAAFGFMSLAKYAHALEALALKVKDKRLLWDNATALYYKSAAALMRAAMSVELVVGARSADLSGATKDVLGLIKNKLAMDHADMHVETINIKEQALNRQDYGLAVRVGGFDYLIPIQSIQEVIYRPEILPVSGSFLSAVESSGNVKNAKLVRYSGRLMPLLSPDALLPEQTDVSQVCPSRPSIPWAIILWDPQGDARVDSYFCLPVDEVIEVREIESNAKKESTTTVCLDRIRDAARNIAA